MSYFLAIDAGGTKTDCLLADDYRELARVRTGTIKRMRGDEAECAANLDSALVDRSHLHRRCGRDRSAGRRLAA
jgi:glucosamine kinase